MKSITRPSNRIAKPKAFKRMQLEEHKKEILNRRTVRLERINAKENLKRIFSKMKTKKL